MRRQVWLPSPRVPSLLGMHAQDCAPPLPHSAPGLRSPLPHQHRDRAHPCHTLRRDRAVQSPSRAGGCDFHFCFVCGGKFGSGEHIPCPHFPLTRSPSPQPHTHARTHAHKRMRARTCTRTRAHTHAPVCFAVRLFARFPSAPARSRKSLKLERCTLGQAWAARRCLYWKRASGWTANQRTPGVPHATRGRCLGPKGGKDGYGTHRCSDFKRDKKVRPFRSRAVRALPARKMSNTHDGFLFIAAPRFC